jgi:beta-lactamase superfamily II metal-dependent hydrolase
MRLIAFQAGKGDSLLLSNKAGTARILIDGGMPAAYRTHIAPALGALRAAGKSIDVAYVSHIDQDHIGGILQLLDDEVAWRVHAHQQAHGNPGHEPPAAARPPKIKAIWHNAFHDQLEKNAGPIEDALAAVAPVLSGSELAEIRHAGVHQGQLVTSIREAIQVSRRISPAQLGIPLNAPSGGKLMMRRSGQAPIVIGGMRLTILGPTTTHLTTLRKDWNAWLKKNTEALASIRETARRDESRLGSAAFSGEFNGLLLALKLQAESFGNPTSVTPPNLASLTLLVEEGTQSILLTGDARGDQMLDGLRASGRMTGATFAVDVLKVPHHGSENNIDSDFCDAIVARHYVFCGNGEHANPNLDVVEMMCRRRLPAPGKFTFWFNCSEAATEQAAAKAHMKALETLVRRLATTSNGRLTVKLLPTGSSFTVI